MLALFILEFMSSEVAETIGAMIAERQQVRETDYARRQASRAEERANHQERRRHGLTKRHKGKLAQVRAGRLAESL